MKILVTGANGLLGQKLVALLQQDKNIELIATARNTLVASLTRGEFHPLGTTSKDQVEKVVTKTKPDVIINTAAMTQVDDCERDHEACIANNVTAVENLIYASKLVDAHFIHLSTDFIFDGTEGPLDELAEPHPVNFYGESKLAAEQLIRFSDINWCILRTVLVYGVVPDMSRSNIVLWVK
ncbi:MAG TPA: SDR family oxidoreductase, partial [Cyclobacteriaceae bacterium]|nr:SDR family oxidoreductase [Cyclobacteriaceae bacterium]